VIGASLVGSVPYYLVLLWCNPEVVMGAKVNMAVKLEPDLRKRLQVLGDAKRRTPHWLMCEAIRLYVEREEKAQRANAEARERLARYDAIGAYVADEDVESWLGAWGTSRERAAPTRKRRVSPR
jgi:predicted transcriptional regulator